MKIFISYVHFLILLVLVVLTVSGYISTDPAGLILIVFVGFCGMYVSASKKIQWLIKLADIKRKNKIINKRIRQQDLKNKLQV
jgi:hypothetical protein